MYLAFEYNFYSYSIIIFEEHLLQKKETLQLSQTFCILENGLFLIYSHWKVKVIFD